MREALSSSPKKSYLERLSGPKATITLLIALVASQITHFFQDKPEVNGRADQQLVEKELADAQEQIRILLQAQENEEVRQEEIDRVREYLKPTDVNRLIEELPTEIQGAKIKKNIVVGAKRVCIHVRLAHFDSYIKDKPRLLDKVNKAQDQILDLLPEIVRHFNTNVVYFESLTSENAKVLNNLVQIHGELPSFHAQEDGGIPLTFEQETLICSKEEFKKLVERFANFLLPLVIDGVVELRATSDAGVEKVIEEEGGDPIRDHYLTYPFRESAAMGKISQDQDRPPAIILVYGALHEFEDNFRTMDEPCSSVDVTVPAVADILLEIGAVGEEPIDFLPINPDRRTHRDGYPEKLRAMTDEDLTSEIEKIISRLEALIQTSSSTSVDYYSWNIQTCFERAKERNIDVQKYQVKFPALLRDALHWELNVALQDLEASWIQNTESLARGGTGLSDQLFTKLEVLWIRIATAERCGIGVDPYRRRLADLQPKILLHFLERSITNLNEEVQSLKDGDDSSLGMLRLHDMRNAREMLRNDNIPYEESLLLQIVEEFLEAYRDTKTRQIMEQAPSTLEPITPEFQKARIDEIRERVEEAATEWGITLDESPQE